MLFSPVINTINYIRFTIQIVVELVRAVTISTATFIVCHHGVSFILFFSSRKITVPTDMSLVSLVTLVTNARPLVPSAHTIARSGMHNPNASTPLPDIGLLTLDS